MINLSLRAQRSQRIKTSCAGALASLRSQRQGDAGCEEVAVRKSSAQRSSAHASLLTPEITAPIDLLRYALPDDWFCRFPTA